MQKAFKVRYGLRYLICVDSSVFFLIIVYHHLGYKSSYSFCRDNSMRTAASTTVAILCTFPHQDSDPVSKGKYLQLRTAQLRLAPMG